MTNWVTASHGMTRTVAFIGLNPSTADETDDDPTVRRCLGFARKWGYDEMVMLNLFALRSTDPKALYVALDPIGPENDLHVLMQAKCADLVVCAWGVLGGFQPRGKYEPRGREVEAILRENRVVLHVLRLTKGGHPGHVLYLPGDLEPVPWEGPAGSSGCGTLVVPPDGEQGTP
jgi:hypothetical protein